MPKTSPFYVQVMCGPYTAIIEEYNVFLKAQQLLAQIVPSRSPHNARRLSAAVQHARAVHNSSSDGDEESCGITEDVHDAAATRMAALPLPAHLLQLYLQQRETGNISPQTGSENENNSVQRNIHYDRHPPTLAHASSGGHTPSSSPSSLSSSSGNWVTVQSALEYVSATYGPLHAITWSQWEELRTLYHTEHASAHLPASVDGAAAATPCVLVEVVLLLSHEGNVYRMTPAELMELEKKRNVDAVGTAAGENAESAIGPSSCSVAVAPSSSSFCMTCSLELEYPPGTLLPRKLPIPLAEPLLTRRELIELVRHTASIRPHQPLRVAYRVGLRGSRVPGVPEAGSLLGIENNKNSSSNSSRMSFMNRSVGGGGCGTYTPTTGGPPLRAIESDEAAAIFIRDTLTYGSAMVRVVAVQHARRAAAALPLTPPRTTASRLLKKRRELEWREVLEVQNGATASARALDADPAAQQRRFNEVASTATAIGKAKSTPLTASTDDDDEEDRVFPVEVKLLSPTTLAAIRLPMPATPYAVEPFAIATGDSDNSEAAGAECAHGGGNAENAAHHLSSCARGTKSEEQRLRTDTMDKEGRAPAPVKEHNVRVAPLEPRCPLKEANSTDEEDSTPQMANTVSSGIEESSAGGNNNNNFIAEDAPSFAKSLGEGCVSSGMDAARNDLRGVVAVGHNTNTITVASTSFVSSANEDTTTNTMLSFSETCSRHSHTNGPFLSSQSDDVAHAIELQHFDERTNTENAEANATTHAETLITETEANKGDNKVGTNMRGGGRRPTLIDELGETWRNPECYRPHAGEHADASELPLEPQPPLTATFRPGVAHSTSTQVRTKEEEVEEKEQFGVFGTSHESTRNRNVFSMDDNDAPARMITRSQSQRATSLPGSDPQNNEKERNGTGNNKNGSTCVSENEEKDTAVKRTPIPPTPLLPASKNEALVNISLNWPPPSPPPLTVQRAVRNRSNNGGGALDPHTMIFVRYEVDPTAVYISGPVSQEALQQLQDVIFRRCCTRACGGEDAPRPRFQRHTKGSHESSTHSSMLSPQDGTEPGTTAHAGDDVATPDAGSHVEYVLPLHAFKFSRAEEVALECCVAEVMAVYQGLEQLPPREAEKWAQVMHVGTTAPTSLRRGGGSD